MEEENEKKEKSSGIQRSSGSYEIKGGRTGIASSNNGEGESYKQTRACFS